MRYLLRFGFFIFDSFHFQYSNSSVCFPISHVPGHKHFSLIPISSQDLCLFFFSFSLFRSNPNVTSNFFAFSFSSTFGVVLPNFQITIIFFLSYKVFTHFFSHKLFLFVQPPYEWKMMKIRWIGRNCALRLESPARHPSQSQIRPLGKNISSTVKNIFSSISRTLKNISRNKYFQYGKQIFAVL